MLGLPSPHPVTIIAETEKQSLVKDLLAIGFAKKGESAIGCPLYEFGYPHVTGDTAKDNLLTALVQRIWEVRRWKLEMNAQTR